MTDDDDLIARLPMAMHRLREVDSFGCAQDVSDAAAALREQQSQIERLVDACNGMIGLVQLVASRDDLPVGLDDVMLLNHRVTEAKAAIDTAMKEAK